MRNNRISIVPAIGRFSDDETLEDQRSSGRRKSGIFEFRSFAEAGI